MVYKRLRASFGLHDATLPVNTLNITMDDLVFYAGVLIKMLSDHYGDRFDISRVRWSFG